MLNFQGRTPQRVTTCSYHRLTRSSCNSANYGIVVGGTTETPKDARRLDSQGALDFPTCLARCALALWRLAHQEPSPCGLLRLSPALRPRSPFADEAIDNLEPPNVI